MKQEQYSPWLEDFTKQYITDKIPPVKRIIVTAANRCPHNDLIIVGARHWSECMRKQCHAMNMMPGQFSEQGFIDQYDQFVTREEAKEICIVNEQPLIGEDWGKELYSENLH